MCLVLCLSCLYVETDNNRSTFSTPSFSTTLDNTGFAVGKTGRAASADIEVSNKGGLGSSFVYTYSEGLLFSVQAVIGARINPPDEENKKFYGTSSYSDILNDKVSPPEGSQVPVLLEKLQAFENGPDAPEE